MKKVGIYVHFPFCASKCYYCNFNSYSDKSNLQNEYIQALLTEIASYKSNKLLVDSIFIGGGTPSFMPDGTIATIISEIKKCFAVDIDCEITIECNPNSVNSTKAIEWKNAGVNRVSIGLQTANEKLLRLIGRIHTKKDYLNAVECIRNAGINNINTDCLIGLPKQQLSDVKHTLKIVTKLQCTHCSVYSLIVEKDTKLAKMLENKELTLPKEEKSLGMYEYACKFLKENGFNRYEVSNFAKKGFECKHNTSTWQMGEYLGFGAGAHSYINNCRYNNIQGIEEYIDAIQNKKLPVEKKEKINNDEKFEETIMLGLRTKYGIDLDEISKNFKIDLLKTKRETINNLLSNGFINLVYNKIIPTDLGFTVLNKIILELVS